MSQASELVRQWAELRTKAEADLPVLADMVRANPDDADAKAAYNEAKEIVATFRAFERGGRPDTPGNTIGIRGIAGDNLTITHDDSTEG